jgi:hypothetical protein
MTMEGRELGRLTAGDVWEITWSVEAIESVLMDLNLDSAEGAREPEGPAGEAINGQN